MNAATRLELDRGVNSLLNQLGKESFYRELDENITFEKLLSDKMLIVAAIRTGIPYALFDLIQSSAPFSESDWATFLHLSTKSLQRYKASARYSFKPFHSERIIEMAEVTREGLAVFGSVEKFKLWLHTPNFALGKLKPIELLSHSYGKEMVLSELVRINHGILV